MASGVNWFKALMLVKKVIKNVQEMKKCHGIFLMKGITAGYPTGGQKKDSRES